MTKIAVSTQTINQEIAAEMLQQNGNYRPIKPARVSELRLLMRRGDWQPCVALVDFDCDGKLIGGQHVLSAIVAENFEALCVVREGLPPKAGEALNDHRAVSLRETLERVYPRRDALCYVARFRMCVHLYDAAPHRIISSADLERWLPQFRRGLDWLATICRSHGYLENCAITGALAFAHKANPDAVEKFGTRYMDGGNRKGTPEHALTALAIRLRTQGRESRPSIARKTLNALHASLRGIDVKQLHDGDIGREFFRGAYKSKQLDALVDAYSINKMRCQ